MYELWTNPQAAVRWRLLLSRSPHPPQAHHYHSQLCRYLLPLPLLLPILVR